MTTTVDTETQAREALQKLIAQHNLPSPCDVAFVGRIAVVRLAEAAHIAPWAWRLYTSAVGGLERNADVSERWSLMVSPGQRLAGHTLHVCWEGPWTPINDARSVYADVAAVRSRL